MAAFPKKGYTYLDFESNPGDLGCLCLRCGARTHTPATKSDLSLHVGNYGNQIKSITISNQKLRNTANASVPSEGG